MAKQRNYLIGYGERLVDDVTLKGGFGDKKPAYLFEEAKDRVSRMVSATAEQLGDLPSEACPNGQTVASFTLHPEYLAKSYYPASFFSRAGLRAIGSRSRVITPEKISLDKNGNERPPKESITTELFVAGSRRSFDQLASRISNWPEELGAAKELTAFEDIAAIVPEKRIKPIHSTQETVPLEVVLHASASLRDRFIINGFKEYLKKWDINPLIDKSFYAGGLCFLHMKAHQEHLAAISDFSFLRVMREVPKLRGIRPTIRSRTPSSKKIIFPDKDAVDPSLRIAVFDGGLPESTPLLPWAEPHETPGIGPAHPELLWHGEAVTSALLFGSLTNKEAQQPYCKVDHYRVLDIHSENDPFELATVLQRIEQVLDSRPYQFINLSIGPELPVDDDDVHAWTAVLDEKFSHGQCLMTVAAGNTGEEPDNPPVSRWRVQVPSDCVNAMAIGASNSRGDDWEPAAYSSRGPGRSPGIVKPDIVAFGGSDQEPFLVSDYDNPGHMTPTAGTSFSSPAALHLGAGIQAHFGQTIGPLATRALLTHAANPNGHTQDSVGWGKIPESLDDLVICPDQCARVVYQDEIDAAKFRRIRIPVPNGLEKCMVRITATFCFATEVDQGHPGNYTQSGLEIIFRPDLHKFDPKKKDATTPLSKEFFKPKELYLTESELRRDAHKWETCLHRSKRFQAKSLNEPVFDIHYNARSEGHKTNNAGKIRYALIITVEAPKVKDLYNQVVRQYRTLIEPLNPIVEIPIRP